MSDLWRIKPWIDSEAPGKTRADAIAYTFQRLNAIAKGRRIPAEKRLRVRRVRRLGPGWWSVRLVRA